MKIVYITLFFSLLFTQSIYLDNNTDLNSNSDESIPLKYPLYSAIIPGLGQYQLYKETKIFNHKIRALSFITIETLSIGFNLSFRGQHTNEKRLYKKFANNNWDFVNWISSYNDFHGTPYENIWMDPNGSYTQIGESSHFVQFSYNGEMKRTTDNDFLEIYSELLNDIENGLDVYEEHSISIIKDQHFYENIGKYNEFFSGWSDADTNNIIVETTGQNYTVALSPKKNNYIDSYDKAEQFSNISEYALSCIYFNHFISMLDAFILARKFGGKVMLNSSTIYDKKRYLDPIGVRVDLIIKL